MKICYIGKKLQQCGSGNIFTNDVKAFTNLGHQIQAIDTIFEDFTLSQIDPKTEYILISADIDAAQKISENPQLRKKSVLFIHGRADSNLDPQDGGNYFPLHFALKLTSYLKLRWFSPSDSKLPRIYNRYKRISYKRVNIHWINIIRQFKRVVVPSLFFGDQLKTILDLDYMKIPYGLDKNYWQPNTRYSTCETRVKIIIPTGFYHFKRLHIGLKKINQVIQELQKKIDIQADFIWYNLEYKEKREEIKQHYPYIKVIDGSPNPKNLFSKYDLIIHPSLGDTFNQTVLECLALGLPVIASSISEDLAGPHLYHLDPRDTEYQNTLKHLILNMKLRLTLSKRAQSFAKNWRTWEDRAQNIINSVLT